MAEYKKGSVKRLSDDFMLSEFDCHGKGCCSKTVVDANLIKALQGFRDYLNIRFSCPVSITVSSGYRCKKHNLLIGGSTTSKHCTGRAADVKVMANGTSVSAKKICCAAQDYGFNGVAYINLGYTHLDTRNGSWYADETRGNRRVGSFYDYFGLERTDKNPYKPPTVSVKRGSTGDAVRFVQWYLYCLKYYDGEIDGRCGPKTVNAIKKFQKARGLAVDGSCGPKTREALLCAW